MRNHAIDNDRVMEIWSWCSEAYLRHGRKMTLPHGTDPAKTYQWRYTIAIARKFEEWDFDEETAKRFIDIAVRHSKQSGTLQKGLASLHQGNILDICYEILQKESDRNVQTIESIKHIHKWLHKKAVSRDLLQVLLHRDDPEGFTNLAMWFQATRVTALYMALSRTCGQAMAILNRDSPEERGLLPRQTELFLLRQEFLHDHSNLIMAREIFANDWRVPCQLPS
jgi:hypothetical protein